MTKETSNLFTTVVANLDLEDTKFDNILVNQEGEVYISMKDAALIAKLSLERIRSLVKEDRLV